MFVFAHSLCSIYREAYSPLHTPFKPLHCYVILLSLMVKLLSGSQGMLPIPITAKVVVVVSGKSCKETGNHSFHLLPTHLHETRDTEEKN